MRAFIALELPPEIKEAVSAIQNKLKTSLPGISWVKPQNLHITLKFLGGISPRQLAETKTIIMQISAITAPFSLKPDGLGVFPGRGQPRIIWLGINEDPAVKGIAASLEREIFKIGIAKEKRDFSGHITIGRVKIPLDPEDLEEELKKARNDLLATNLEFKAMGITLFESVLGGSDGPVYTALKEANFKIT